MEWSLESVLVQMTLALSMILGILYSYITHKYDYWKKRGIFSAEPSFPFGNFKDLLFAKTDIGQFYERFYKQFKGKKYGGIHELRTPTLILTDLDMVKQVVTKDFNYFMDRALPPKPSHDYLANHLFAMEGNEWKHMRTKLTPSYSSGKMKLMYSLIEVCSEQLKNHLEPLAVKSQVIDIKEVMSRFTIDIIASCAFGLDVNTLADSNTDFYEVSQLIFKQSKVFFLKRAFMATFPKTANFLRMTLIDRKVNEFLMTLVNTTVSYREKNLINRNDFMDLLIKIKNNALIDEKLNAKDINSTKESLSLKEIAAQAFVFFAAGFETAASTMTFVLYELAQNPKIQERLRQEIDEKKEEHGGKITYQVLQEMPYMEQILNETLRMHGSAPILVRKCTEPYKLPNTNVTLDKDVKVVIPSYAIHHDPEIYPKPFEFDPERFTVENIKSRHNYSFLPFGEGPRMCIGMRFGKMQVKAGLITIIGNYELSLTPETPVPVEISPNIIVTTPIHPIKLKITKRT